MKAINEQARGLSLMNRNQGAVSAFSGRAGAMKDKRRESRAKTKVNLRKGDY